MKTPTLAASALGASAGALAMIRTLATPGKLSTDELQVIVASVLAMAIGEQLLAGREIAV